jgi:alkylated DNA repair protein (DNA oxidative demethylase)
MNGFQLLPSRLDGKAQSNLVAALDKIVAAAPLFTPVTPGGQPFSVRMTNCGRLGWVSDRAGYRYQAHHPVTGQAWPPIPEALLGLWAEHVDAVTPPDACLINLYGPGARMGLHQDRDEADFRFGVLSVSLGDTAVFRIGTPKRGGKTRSVRLSSGDVCILAGEDRLAFHGIDRVISGSSQLISGGGRINLTLRKAGAP